MRSSPRSTAEACALALLATTLSCVASPGRVPATPDPAAPPPPGPVLDALFPDGRRTESLESLLAGPGLAPGEDFVVREIGRDAGTSHHVVWIRYAEVPHRHDLHDLWVVILRGYGEMRLDGRAERVGPGSILYVPRGTVHAFENAASGPAAAYAVYAPPFDGRDRVSVPAGVGPSSSGP